MSFKENAVKFVEQMSDRKPTWVTSGRFKDGTEYVRVFLCETAHFFYEVSEIYAYQILSSGIEMLEGDKYEGKTIDIRTPYDIVDVSGAWQEYMVEKLQKGELKTPKDQFVIVKMLNSLKEELKDYLSSFEDGYIASTESDGSAFDEIMDRIIAIEKVRFKEARKKSFHESHYRKVIDTINREMYFLEKQIDDAYKMYLEKFGKPQKDKDEKEFYIVPEKDRALLVKLRDKIEEVEAMRRQEVYLTDQREDFGAKEE